MTEEEPKKKMPVATEKLMKGAFDAFRTPKPEEEDWAFNLNPLSENPTLDPTAKVTEGRVADITRQMEELRRPIPRTTPTIEQMEEQVYSYLYRQHFQNDLPAHVRDQKLREEFDAIFTSTKSKPVNQVYSIHKITKVIYCKYSKMRTYPHTMYTIWKVKRSDRSENQFSDADIRNLNPYDLPDLLQWTKDNFNDDCHQRSYRVLRKAMREKLLIYSMLDFQLAIDLGVTTLSIRPPEDFCPPNAIPNSIIKTPRYGLVFKNPADQLRLFVTMDCQKYTTRTLNMFRKILEENKATELMDEESALMMIKEIDAALGIRNLCFKFYEELKEVGKDNRKFDDFPNAKI